VCDPKGVPWRLTPSGVRVQSGVKGGKGLGVDPNGDP
jgi:hypothetical protein